MRSSRILLSALAATTALVLSSASTAAAGTPDQQQPTGSTTGDFVDLGALTGAQGFRAGISGQLDQVDLLVDKLATSCGGSPPDLTVQIRAVDGAGAPTANVLANTTVATGAIPEYTGGLPAALTPARFASPATVSAGSPYAIVVPAAGAPNCYVWYRNTGNPYSGGVAYTSADGSSFTSLLGADQGFRTYVAPTPTAPPAKKKCKKKKKKKSSSAESAKKKKCKKKKKK